MTVRKAPLHYAAITGNVEIVQVLLEANANVNINDVCDL